MNGSRGCFMNTLLFLVIVFIPLVGQLIETFMVLEDDHSGAGKVIWLIVIWLIPVVGPFLYLVFGQRPVRRTPVGFGRATQSRGAY